MKKMGDRNNYGFIFSPGFNFVIQLLQSNMSNDISSRALIRSMILMDTSLLIVIRFFSWRKYNRFTCRNTLETKFSFLKLFRIVKVLLWKVLLPRHARQPLHLPTMHRQYVSLSLCQFRQRQQLQCVSARLPRGILPVILLWIVNMSTISTTGSICLNVTQPGV